MSQIRILLVDDQPLLRMGFRMILEAESDFAVIGEAGDGAEAMELVERTNPDVVLMDVRMPRVDGIEATERVVASGAPSRVIILTTFDVDEYAFAALEAGASAFLLKSVAPEQLVDAVRVVHGGDSVVAPRVTARLLESFVRPQPATPNAPALTTGLTERELEVVHSLAEGLSNSEIATKLFLSETTVKTHVGRILTKLELRDRVQVVIWAYERGIVVPGG